MAWVTIATLSGLGDASAAALARNTTTDFYRALGERTAAMVSDAIAASPTVVSAAQTAAQTAAASVIGTAIYNRGNLANGTDLNTLYGSSNNGIWSLPSASSYPNHPSGGWAARLEVRSTTNNTTEQTVSRFLSTESYRRVLTSTAGPTWSAWVRQPVNPFFRGQLADGINWDSLQFNTGDWNGSWTYTIPQIPNFAGTLPPVTQHGTLTIDSQSTWTARQTVVETRTNNTYVRTMTNPSGPVWTAWTLAGSSAGGGGTSGNGIALSRDWLHIGDSLTDDVVLGTSQWGAVQATLDGAAHEIRGWYNQKTFEIATRAGAQLYPVTVSGGSIPAAASVTVTGLRGDQLAFGGYTGLQNRRIYGWLGNRYGYLQNPTNAATMVFTPSDAVETATAASGTVWFQGDMDAYMNRIFTIWTGANDLSTASPDLVVGWIRSMLQRFRHQRGFVFLITGRDTLKPQVAAMNAAYRAAFPGLIFDTTAALTSAQAATDAGITFTAQDNTDITNGVVPTSFRSDGVHLNATGARALAYAVHREAVARGYSRP